ncbi:chorismate mutase [Vagococcus xieshaowenii]|uniref:Chorismate mutase n=1 Tax=Vagococcus xieshaowenii TaxID=2562451 RepID=A0AAJ5EEK3_9ENTE|nr:chorismate mutase [Vagococcus xieshaowenii]QCA29348.1 chorismate mutase [Vagococcus xieshaowenii]TFZ39360.1 chorismate mutase [Vagococcus xieshaowenii]
MENARRKIDDIDHQLVALLEERMQVVEEVISIKKAQTREVLDEDREKDVLKKVSACIKHKEYEPCILAIYEEILTVSKVYQVKKLTE